MATGAGGTLATRRRRPFAAGIVVTAVCAALIAVPTANAEGGVAASGATFQAGYLDKSFYGGKGYRVLTPPTWAKATGEYRFAPGSSSLVATPTGRLRTFESYEDKRLGGEVALRYIVRGWSGGGGIDTAFYSGKARDTGLLVGGEGGDVVDDVAAVGEGVAWTSAFYSTPGEYRGHTGELLGGNGRLVDTWRYQYCSDDQACLDYGAPAASSGRTLDGAGTTWSCVASSMFTSNLTGATRLVTIPRSGAPTSGPELASPNCHSLARAADGRLFVVAKDAGGAMVLRSLTNDGTLNPAWGAGGSAKPVAISGAWRSSGVRTAGNRVYVALERLTTDRWNGGRPDGRVMVIAYTKDGVIDPSFGGDGVVLTGAGGDVATATPRALGAWTADSHGVVLALNGTPDVQKAGGANRFILMRVRASNGRADPSFGTNGWLATSGPGIEVIARGGRYLTLSGGPIHRTLKTFTYAPLVIARRTA